MQVYRKIQVRVKLKCVKYEWEVGGMWGRSVSKNLCTLLLTLHKFTTGAETSGSFLK